ncbi:uncharacterized protein LOC129765677 [Toxorhynchites rutilus septentrionalis]|uniref:uncharacterized protein LOC129765677 n=1 Tax=Toxorhynchites rutilus septentrionalis TaxID=329112 RepID=UPI002479B819|nr:uncharacterized protein LOC129765677 [Toxorhynchites rutilus septentrionalis]
MEDRRTKQQLRSRRETMVASLGRADQFMTQYDEERDKLEVAVRLQHLDGICNGMEEIQVALEDMADNEQERVRNMEIRSEFETLFFRIKAFLQSKLPPPIDVLDNLPRNAAPSTLKGLKLPTISLPEFSGDYKDWLAFHDTFEALIHNNSEVVEVQKFHYLKAALKGEAAQLIESIGISSANYRLAWEALVNRYANEYLLKKRHLQALFESPKMQIESASSLHGIVDEFERHVKILEQLGEPISAWSSMLEHLLCTRLHDDTLKVWEDHASTLTKPTYTCLIDFLQRRMRVLESISVNHQLITESSSTSHNCHINKKSAHSNYYSHAAVENQSAKCYACDQHHPLIKCWKFSKMPIAEKMKVVNAKRLCLNCFRSDHFSRNCSSKYSCKICKKRHHSLLHSAFSTNVNRSATDQNPSPSTRVPSMPVQVNVTPCENPARSTPSAVDPCEAEYSFPLHERSKNTFMLTALLIVVDCYGNEHLARALLDCGSQPNIISERMAQLLRLRRKRVNVSIHGVGNKPQYATESVFTESRSRKENFALNVDFLVLNNIMPQLPTQDIPIEHWKLPKNLFLADPNFNKSSGIDMIIGNAHFFSCLKTSANIQLPKPLPLLVDSVFGWLVSGTADITRPDNGTSSCTVTTVSLVALEDSLERFWKIEDLPDQPNYSMEEKQCEELYSATVMRNETGRYVVRLPRRPNFEKIVGESKNCAFRRYLLLEKRLERDPALKDEYRKLIEEYIELGQMKAVLPTEPQHYKGCFLPHHPVMKESSATTKVRVVFDASARTSTGHSLNDGLLVGPVIQDDLLSIIHASAHFLWHWWRTLRKCTARYSYIQMTPHFNAFYGDSMRVIPFLANDEAISYPAGSAALRKSFYMDDFIGGAQTVEDAMKLRQELNELLGKGGFNLRKWTSNKLEIVRGLREDQIGMQSTMKFDKGETVKALGISWEPQNDLFRFDANIKREDEMITKRKILSAIAQLFDPLGLIAPVIIQGKILMQLIWMESCGWDDELPSGIVVKWKNFYEHLPSLTEFRINRYAMLPRSTVHLHTFSDASESAYGACTYARCVDTQGNISVQLLAAKSRVAPLKRISLPRLELCPATLGAKLHARVQQALQIEISSSYLCFHPFSRLLATHYHLKLIHGGGRLTLSTMREKYWPINGRRLVRSVIRGCYRCARANPVPENQKMGQLPIHRITQSRPFSSTGVDYAGPIYLKPTHRRAAAMKAYISIFVCFCTKAVHIELVSDLTTPAFIAALRRFVARRGRPAEIFSDNGKNFEGAKNHLAEVHQQSCEHISTVCTNEGITWHMNPPRAPHFGGLWEAAVKIAKKHLYRQLGNTRLSFEDMSTVLTQIEAAMNSRPLVPMSEDPNDFACLTPAHFLIGTTMQTVAEIDVRNLPLNRLDHYQKMQQTYQQFWHHWRKEYLQEMQRCTTRRKPNNEFNVGRLVVVVDEFQHPVKWSLGRILSAHPGPDQLIRVVTLQTARGILKRPITKICLLPYDAPEMEAANNV